LGRWRISTSGSAFSSPPCWSLTFVCDYSFETNASMLIHLAFTQVVHFIKSARRSHNSAVAAVLRSACMPDAVDATVTSSDGTCLHVQVIYVQLKHKKHKHASAQILGPMPSCGERVMIVAVGIGSTIDLCEVSLLQLICWCRYPCFC
jgi:hypothetical protein